MGKETISRKTFAKGLTAGVVVAASLGILSVGEYTIGGGSSSNENSPASAQPEVAVSAAITEAAEKTESPVSAEGSYTPGTYTASSAGISSDITVTATFDESGITALEADVSGETAGIGAEIGDEMIEKVLSSQSADVDGIAGATITSNAFKAAVADCIAQASGDVSEAANETATETVTEVKTEEETTVTNETEAENTATEAVEEDTAETADTAVIEEETADEATTEAAETSVETADQEAAETAAVSVTPGTYTASAPGISSDVVVTATFDETGIVEITTDVLGETAGIGAEIGDTMIQRALDAQSSEIDGVAGATITSTAFRDALADCIAQAGFSSAAEAESETELSEAVEVPATATSDTVPAPDGPFVPGTYTATAKGLASDVVVNATFDENNIIAVGTYLGGESPDHGADIGADMAEKILAAQSAEVDGISGATSTSDAIKEALSDCIAQANGTKSAQAAVSYLEKATLYAVSKSPDGPFTAGMYTATAEGMAGDIIVTMTFDETRILDMDIDVSNEPAGYGGMIDNDLIDRILAEQSANVDGISGATITSDAIKEAVSDCIAQAGAEADQTVAIIGGADGPTSVFIAGKLTEEESESESEPITESEE